MKARLDSATSPTTIGYSVARPLLILWRFENLFVGMRDNWAWGWAYAYAVLGLLSANLLTINQMMTVAIMKQQSAGFEAEPTLMGATRTGLIIGAVLTPFTGPLLKAAVSALVIHLVSAVLSVRVRFSKLFSLALHAHLPAFTIGSLITAVVVLNTPPETIPTISFSPAVFFSPNTSAWYALMKSLDVFNLWSLGLLAVGYATIQRVPIWKVIIPTLAVLSLVFIQVFAFNSTAG